MTSFLSLFGMEERRLIHELFGNPEAMEPSLRSGIEAKNAAEQQKKSVEQRTTPPLTPERLDASMESMQKAFGKGLAQESDRIAQKQRQVAMVQEKARKDDFEARKRKSMAGDFAAEVTEVAGTAGLGVLANQQETEVRRNEQLELSVASLPKQLPPDAGAKKDAAEKQATENVAKQGEQRQEKQKEVVAATGVTEQMRKPRV